MHVRPDTPIRLTDQAECVSSGVPVNWTLSNLYSEATNLNHHVKRGKEIEKERPNALFAAYRAGLGVGGHFDIIGVERVENLKIFFPAPG